MNRSPLHEYRTHAWERIGAPGRWLFTCEHASPRVPAPLRTTASDRAWLQTHWGYDIGARTATRQLVRDLGGAAVLSRFSRLVVDANRPPEHPDLVRQEIEGTPLSFNQHLADIEVHRRLLVYFHAYHTEVDHSLALACRTGPTTLVSVHSFTPIWNLHVRPMDVGVLFDRDEAQARALAGHIAATGLRVALNEPYSGRDGLIYAADRHGRAHGVDHVELELNQALVSTPWRARQLARSLARCLAQTWP